MTNPDLARARQQEIRAQLLKALDRERPKPVAESIVLRSLLQNGLTLNRDSLISELAYLEAKGLTLRHDVRWQLLPLGVDVLEHNVPDIPGIPVNGALSPETLAYRQEVRGRLLMALYFARPHGATAVLLWRALDDSDLPVSDKELSREADYLAGKNLIAIDGDVTTGNWSAALTAQGQDVMEYNVAAPPGVKLIDKYWE